MADAQQLSGAVCLVTGGCAGIGLATATGLARLGARVVIVGRSAARCEPAVAAVVDAVPGAEVDWIAADLSVQAEVRTLAQRFTARQARLDVLVNNAATIVRRRTLSADGIELTLAVNHLAPFLLTELLRDRLVASAPARVINVSSVGHAHAVFDPATVQTPHGYRPFRAYATSKLCNLMFSYELARRLDGTGVTVNAVEPGLVRTGLGRGNGPLLELAWRLTHLRHRAASTTPESAAEAVLHAACAPELAATSGAYLSQRRPAQSSAVSRDRAAAGVLWTLSQQLCGTEHVLSTTASSPPAQAYS